jgi:hypothetical protein
MFFFCSYFDRIQPDNKVEGVLIIVSGILRLSTKYCIQPVRQKCINTLASKIPTSFPIMKTIFGARSAGYHESTEMQQIPPFLRMRIINLARETNVPQLLPFVFYLCARLDSDLVFNGIGDDVLSWEDKAICLLGREKLLQAQRSSTHEHFIDFKPLVGVCRRHTVCPSILPEIPRKMWEHRVLLKVLTFEIYNPATIPFHACTECLNGISYLQERARERVWNMLPEMFQLVSWADIQNAQNE